MEKYKRAQAIQEKAHGENHPQVAKTLGGMGIVLEQQGQLEEAMEKYECAHGIFMAQLGPDPPSTMQCRELIASCRGASAAPL